MDREQIQKELKNVFNEHKYDTIHFGEIKLATMASDCLSCIEELINELAVAEEALKMACKEVATITYGTLAFKINIIDTIVQDVMKKCKQQAEERLKERV